METEDSMVNVMLAAIFAVAGIAVLTPTLQRIFSAMPSARMLQAQTYTGLTDERRLNANPTIQWLNLISDPPYVGWIRASFFNDGDPTNSELTPSVFIGINNPGELHEVAYGESYNVDFAGAQRRIEFVYYKTNLGEKASVRIIAKY